MKKQRSLKKNEESKAAEVNAGAATPENLTCQVEPHDPNFEMVLDGSVKLQILAENPLRIKQQQPKAAGGGAVAPAP